MYSFSMPAHRIRSGIQRCDTRKGYACGAARPDLRLGDFFGDLSDSEVRTAVKHEFEIIIPVRRTSVFHIPGDGKSLTHDEVRIVCR